MAVVPSPSACEAEPLAKVLQETLNPQSVIEDEKGDLIFGEKIPEKMVRTAGKGKIKVKNFLCKKFF